MLSIYGGGKLCLGPSQKPLRILPKKAPPIGVPHAPTDARELPSTDNLTFGEIYRKPQHHMYIGFLPTFIKLIYPPIRPINIKIIPNCLENPIL